MQDQSTKVDLRRRLPTDAGYFYVVALQPDTAPGRLKLGWTRQPRARLRSYRAHNPTAAMLVTWPCLRRDEPWAIDYAANLALRRLSDEVFEFADTAEVVRVIDQFFASRGVGRAGIAADGPLLARLSGRRPRLDVADETMTVEFEVALPPRGDPTTMLRWLDRNLFRPLGAYLVERAILRHDGAEQRFRIRVERELPPRPDQSSPRRGPGQT